MSQTSPTNPPSAERPAPWGPGPMMVFGLAFLAVTAYCFADLFLRGKAEEWRQQGNDWYIPLNWAVMLATAGGAVYSFIQAARRSKKPAAGDSDSPK